MTRQTPHAAGDPVSRLGASRGHGQYPAPPQSRTSIGTQSRQIGPGPIPVFLSAIQTNNWERRVTN
jgi:hypothetical protein